MKNVNIRCPHCLGVFEVSENSAYAEVSRIKCKKCNRGFNLYSKALGYEPTSEFDLSALTYGLGLGVVGAWVKEEDKYAVSCWLEKFLEAGNTEPDPEAWSEDRWQEARKQAIFIFSKLSKRAFQALGEK